MGAGKNYTRICEDCGVVMVNVGPRRRFCPACLGRRCAEKTVQATRAKRAEWKEYEAQRMAERAEAMRKAHPYPKKPTKENSLGAVCSRAAAAGRTYGQQVEFERRQKELRDRGEID